MQLVHSVGYRPFRNRLGQANHVLITILVGLEGVRTGAVKKGEDFHTSWNPKSVEDSAQRSRRFARDAMLNHVVDSLAVYLEALRDDAYRGALPGLSATAERSIKSRLDVVCSDLKIGLSATLALVHLAIQWRNRRLHTDAQNKVDQEHVGALRSDRAIVAREFSGLDVDAVLKSFEQSHTPRFKEVASLVKAALDLVQSVDSALVRRVSPEGVAHAIIASALRQRIAADRRRAGQQWGNSNEKRRAHIAQLLISSGFSADATDTSLPHLSEDYIADLASMRFADACAHFEISVAAS